MTNKPPFAVILLVVFVCSGLGILNVLLGVPSSETAASQTPDPPTPQSAPTTNDPLQSVLILGVDKLGNAKPTLRSVWIALFQPTGETVYMHGVSLNESAPSIDPRTLGELFDWSNQEGLNPTFEAALFQIIPLPPDLVVVLDEVAFAALVNYVGGVDVAGALFDGESVLAFLSVAWPNPDLLLENQAMIIKGIIPRAIELAPSPELTDLIQLIPEHASISLDVTDAVGLISPLRKITPENVFFILLGPNLTQ